MTADSPEIGTACATLAVWSPVDSAVHRMHCAAVASYAGDEGVETVLVEPGRRGLRTLRSLPTGTSLYVQSTGVVGLLALPARYRLRERSLFYLHEPSALRVKVQRDNGLLKSLVWQLCQVVDVRLAARTMVSREELAESASTIYGVPRSRFVVGPLVVPPPLPERAGRRSRITYLGRLDSRRYLADFLSWAPQFRESGLRPTILTGSRAAASDLPDTTGIEVIAQPDFSEETKARVLSESVAVWNPKTYRISQSGVTVDALRYGCGLISNENEPYFSYLESRGLAIHFSRSAALIGQLAGHSQEELAVRTFRELAGADAFTRAYVQHIA